jgi:hypothetical protein
MGDCSGGSEQLQEAVGTGQAKGVRGECTFATYRQRL